MKPSSWLHLSGIRYHLVENMNHPLRPRVTLYALETDKERIEEELVPLVDEATVDFSRHYTSKETLAELIRLANESP